MTAISSSVRGSAVSATFWGSIDVLFRQGISFVITLVLARLLTPVDYGTVGLLAVFTGLVSVFIDSGFSASLIQRKNISELEISSVFYFNMVIALFAAILLVLLAPYISAFFGVPALKPLIWVLGLELVIGATGGVHSALLSKTLNFKRQCLISVVSIVVSGVVAIGMAANGFGYWSLVAQVLIATLVSTTLLWRLGKWIPRRMFSLSSLRSLFRFGGYLLLSSLLETLFSRLNSLVIGKLYSAKDLGYYSRADSLQQLPVSFLSGIVARVAFPLFSVANDDATLLRTGLRKSIRLIMLLNIPIMFGMAVTAKTLVPVLFGEQWSPCVPYLQILSLGGVLWPLHMLNLSVLKAQGRSDLFFRLEMIKKVSGIALILTACPFGILAICWSLVLFGIIAFLLNAFYSGKLLQYGITGQVLDILPCLVSALFMSACAWLVSLLPVRLPTVLLCCQILIGALAYFAFCFVFRLTIAREALQFARTILHRHSPAKS